ncbi:MAG: TylF/MycF/NovP-related O-methyltransferase [Ferruginibacter sp.]
MNEKENSIQANLQNHTDNEKQLFFDYGEYFKNSDLDNTQKLQAFTKYIRRQDLSRFLAKNELFKLQLNLPGIIVECGCYAGAGTFTFGQLSAIYEPYNHTRKVVAFDTFEGFPSLAKQDKNSSRNYEKGELFVHENIEEEIKAGISLFDRNRPLSHIPKIMLCKGDAMQSIPGYIKENPHTIVSLLYLDFDIYEPTKIALETFLPRMPKGSVLAFDELNAASFPGETLALLMTLGIKNVQLMKTSFDSYISYAVL